MKYGNFSMGQVEAMCNREEGVQRLLAGELEVVPKRPLVIPQSQPLVIDCDAEPDRKGNWQIAQHIKGGLWTWDPTKVSLFWTESQKAKKRVNGHQVLRELEGQRLLNACVMDALVANPEHIHPEWQRLCKGEQGKRAISITFWGTQFQSGSLGPCPFSLSYIPYSDGIKVGWYSGFKPYNLDADWSDSPAAVLID